MCTLLRLARNLNAAGTRTTLNHRRSVMRGPMRLHHAFVVVLNCPFNRVVSGSAYGTPRHRISQLAVAELCVTGLFAALESL